MWRLDISDIVFQPCSGGCAGVPSAVMRPLPERVARLMPDLETGESLVEWGPVKVKADFTEGHPLGRASGVFMLTSSRLWYVGTATRVGIPRDRMASVAYDETWREGRLAIAMESGSKYEFFESKRAMRPLRDLLGSR